MNNSVMLCVEINCNVITVLVWVKTLWTTVGGRISRHFFCLMLKLWRLYERIKHIYWWIRGFDLEYIHTGPVIRREQIFSTYSMEERRKLLYKMLYFYNKCDIYHDTVIVNRKEATDKISLSGRLSKEIAKIIARHAAYFNQLSTRFYQFCSMRLNLERLSHRSTDYCKWRILYVLWNC